MSLGYKQSQDLSTKILLTNQRIFDWYMHNNGNVYVAFSGGKDSTVLLDLVRKQFPDVPAVFVDTGLEFPEIREFVKTVDNVVWIKPKISFKKILEKYGYPVISKKISMGVSRYRNTRSALQKELRKHGGINPTSGKKQYQSISNKWHFLIDAPFRISDECCNVLKKAPFKRYEKQNDATPFIGIMASESNLRQQNYYKYGCNAYDMIHPQSRPIIFWRENDIWDYIKKNDLKYSKIYNMGYERTGCMFCMYGLNREEKGNTRFDKMKVTHPKQYNYCMNKLGLKDVIDFIDTMGVEDLQTTVTDIVKLNKPTTAVMVGGMV